jgi:DNA-binding NarL/FixJ family response regulator
MLAPYRSLKGLRFRAGFTAIEGTALPCELPTNKEESMKTRVLVIDDHLLVAEGLRKLLECQFDLVGSAGEAITGINLAKETSPDIVLMDISLPGMNGLEATRRLKTEVPTARVIFVTVQTSRVYVEEAMRAGGWGFVSKHAAASELADAIQEVVAGRRYVTPAARVPFVRTTRSEEPTGGMPVRLTGRQQQVLQLVAEGKTIKEIASVLHISPKTVEFHKANLMKDLGMNTSGELIRFALAHMQPVP